jgi:hypothetical protein
VLAWGSRLALGLSYHTDSTSLVTALGVWLHSLAYEYYLEVQQTAVAPDSHRTACVYAPPRGLLSTAPPHQTLMAPSMLLHLVSRQV